MIADPPSLPISQWIQTIVPNVFRTMLTLDALPAAESQMPEGVDRVVGTIGLGGPSIAGTIYLQLTAPLAEEVTASLLGLPAGETPVAADVNDAVGELCNMVSGGLKSTLMDHGLPCAISTPTIIRGTSFAVEVLSEAIPTIFYFDCPRHRLAVEVHLQFFSNSI